MLVTLLAIGIGFWLHWPSVDSGFRGDDYVQGAMLHGQFPARRAPLDLFDFASGERGETARLQDFGYVPWWSVPELRLRMLRPLASALIAQDHAHFGWHARPMHVHSMVWFALLLCAASLLLHTLLPPSAAGLALLLFAVEEGFTFPVGWLANRSTLVATTLAFLSVAVYVRGRMRGARVDAWAASLFAITALLAGEYALTGLAYVFAYECVGRGEPLVRRLRASSFVALPVIVYLVAHSALGADVAGSGYYLSPTHEPLAFASALFSRVPVLLADLVFGMPSGYFNGGAPLRAFTLSMHLFERAAWRALPDWPTWHVALGYLALVSYFGLVRFACSEETGHGRRALACLGLGGFLALFPSAGSLPGDRLVIAGALGVSAIAARVILRAQPLATRHLPVRARVLHFGLCLALLVVLAGLSTQRTYQQARFIRLESEALRIWALDADLPSDADAAEARVYVIASADFTTAANLPWLRLVHGHPLARSYRRLCPATAAVDLTRVDERTLDVTVLTADLRGGGVPSLYRSERAPLDTGFAANLPGLSVHVLRSVRGNPFVMRFGFDRSLDDPALVFLHSTEHGLRRITMPALGASLRLPKPVLNDLRFSVPPKASALDPQTE